jgi:hypothetical protein
MPAGLGLKVLNFGKHVSAETSFGLSQLMLTKAANNLSPVNLLSTEPIPA